MTKNDKQIIQNTDTDRKWMRAAIDQAKIAMGHGDAPIGAILICDGDPIATAYTQVLSNRRDTAHAEMNIISKIEINRLRNYRDVTLYCTLEPCIMCLGACIHAQVKRIVFGMRASTDGGQELGHSIRSLGMFCPEISGGVLEHDVVALMNTFVSGKTPEAPGVSYIQSILSAYGR